MHRHRHISLARVVRLVPGQYTAITLPSNVSLVKRDDHRRVRCVHMGGLYQVFLAIGQPHPEHSLIAFAHGTYTIFVKRKYSALSK